MANQENLVSIIVPNFNRSSYLKEALGSVAAQSYTQWECIVVDDGSEDDSLAVVAAFARKDGRIRAISNKGKGAAAARNWGAANAKGKYIIFLDSDDLLAPFCLQQRVGVMESEEALDFAVFPMLLFFKKAGDSRLLWNIDKKESDVSRFLELDAVWQTTGPIWKKESLLKLPLFDERLSCWQDVGFHINVLLSRPTYKKFYQLPPDCYYRKGSSESISQQRINTQAHLTSRHWLVSQLQQLIKKERRFSAKTMYLSYYFSSLNSGNIAEIPGSFLLYIKEYRPGLKELLQVTSLSFLKGLRLTKIVYLQELYSLKVSALLPENSIGKHRYVG